MKKAWVVVPAGHKYEIPADTEEFQVAGITELYPGEILSLQLLQIPDDVEAFGVVTPADLPEEDRWAFEESVSVAWFGVQTTRCTVKHLFPIWIENALKNYNILKMAKPVDQLPKKGTKALIVGNGPSLRGTLEKLKDLPMEDVAVFSCWHAAHKVQEAGIKVDYLLHTDHEFPGFDFKQCNFPFDTIFIATHKAAPEFVEMSNYYQTYAYLPLDNPLAGYFAKAIGSLEHENIHSTVVSMAINSAVYAGYDELILAGVDNSWTPDQPDYPGVTEPTEITNSHGVTLKTFSVFALAAYGLEQKFKKHPSMKVYQTTINALDIGGVEYKPIEDILNGG